MRNSIKLQIGDTLSAIFSYAFKQYPTVLKASLIPIAILFVVTFWFVLPGLMDTIVELASLDEAADSSSVLSSSGSMLASIFLLAVLSLVFYAIVLTPLLRNVMFGEPVGFLRVDGTVWRVLASFILIYIIMIAAVVAFTIPLGIVMGLMAASGDGAAGFEALMMLLMYVFVLAIMVKLFLVLPDVAASGRLRIMPGWRASKGNFWRVFAVFLIAYVVIMIISYAGMIIAFVIAGIGLAGNETLQTMDWAQMEPAQLAEIWDVIISSPTSIFAIIVYGLISIFGIGALAAILGTVYRTLVLEGAEASFEE